MRRTDLSQQSTTTIGGRHGFALRDNALRQCAVRQATPETSDQRQATSDDNDDDGQRRGAREAAPRASPWLRRQSAMLRRQVDVGVDGAFDAGAVRGERQRVHDAHRRRRRQMLVELRAAIRFLRTSDSAFAAPAWSATAAAGAPWFCKKLASGSMEESDGAHASYLSCQPSQQRVASLRPSF